MNNKGISLLELLVATALLVTVSVSVSLFLPKAVKSAGNSRNQNTARTIAAGRLQELKQIPYALVAARQANGAATDPFPINDATCDCSQLGPGAMPIETVILENALQFNALSFERHVCINLVGANLTTPSCILADGSNDTGYKAIRVAVKYFPTNAAPQAIIDAPFIQMSTVISR